MTEAQEILVVFLSVALAVFLTLGIILLAFAIKIVSQISRITEKAEAIITTAGETLDHLHNATTFAMLGNAINRIGKMAFGGKKNHKD